MTRLSSVFSGIFLCSLVSASDFTVNWESEWGWVSNFHDEFTSAAEPSVLSVSAGVDQYNFFQLKLNIDVLSEPNSYLNGDTLVLATDLGSYWGFGYLDILLESGMFEAGMDNHADFSFTGYAGVGSELADLSRSWCSRLRISYGPAWGSAASDWNIGVEDNEPERQVLLALGMDEPVPGLFTGVGVRLNPDRSGMTVSGNGMMILPEIADSTEIIIGGSFSWTNLQGMDFIDIYGLYTPFFAVLFGIGMDLKAEFPREAIWITSVSFKGDETELFRALGLGTKVSFGERGLEASTSLNMTLAAGDPSFEGLDLSCYAIIKGAEFVLGYVFTDGYGWSNRPNAPMTAIGGVYMNINLEF